MRIGRTSLSVLLAITAALLLVGAMAYATTVPGRSRPGAEDLPRIVLEDGVAAPTSTPEPPAAQDATAPVTVEPADDEDDDEREVVTPDVRDSDDENDGHDDGESSDHEDEVDESED